ncbi:hypothetical protein [Subtercola lobariae]|uniref:DUF3800 domain-containing protein n=1 Tax=Subtercola lobariae TaxID=1588641 RepID=A0A917B002_9MICO|nr:hypothetical protein [Subtercola lobariae]GGF10877.1 hypothetical protein GCM10011399_00850 [Subtercola lobariae]
MTLLFLDESKSSDYYIVTLCVEPANANRLRKAVSGLRKSGQRRVHFVKESDSRRRHILSTLASLNLKVSVYRAGGFDDLQSRRLCLAAVVRDSARQSVTRITLESDLSIEKFDRHVMYEELSRLGETNAMTYVHERAASEPLLWVPDAIAWCVARGGHWKRRVDPLVESVIGV